MKFIKLDKNGNIQEQMVSLEELKDILNLGKTRIHQLVSEGVIEKIAPNKYALFASLRNYLNYQREQIVQKYEGRHSYIRGY